MQLKIRRSQPKPSRKRQALIAAGAVGLAAGATMRRRRHRQHDEEPAEDELIRPLGRVPGTVPGTRPKRPYGARRGSLPT